MDLAIIILAILFLMGYNVGKALAICSIIAGACTMLKAILDLVVKYKNERS